MLSNLLKAVGVEPDAPGEPPNSPTSPGGSSVYTDYDGGAPSSHPPSHSSPAREAPPPSPGGRSAAPSNPGGGDLASTLGGLLGNFQPQPSAPGGPKVGGVGGPIGVGSRGRDDGRAFGGRSYYADGFGTGAPTGATDGAGFPGRPRGGNRRGGKSPYPVQLGSNSNNGGLYQGRRMVADVDHLYAIVDDRAAVENYDALLEGATAATLEAEERLQFNDGGLAGGGSEGRGRQGRKSRQGRRGSQRDENSQEQKREWARRTEEELVERMLSQFPEFGTNRPTPFTVLDDADNAATDDGLVPRRAHSPAPPSLAGTEGDATTTSDADHPYSPARFLGFPHGDDASDLLGRFFFGWDEPTEGAATDGPVPTSAGGDGGADGAAGARSTMARGGQTKGAAADRDTTASHGAGGPGDERAAAWDRDEIELWTSGGAGGASPRRDRKAAHPRPGTGGATHEGEAPQRGGAGDGAGSGRAERRRRHRDRQRRQREAAAALAEEERATANDSAPPSAAEATAAPPAPESVANAPRPTTGGSPLGAVRADPARQHWMPDRLVKNCHGCEAPFTLLRRKHHCRVCGMIFCGGCAAHFVRIAAAEDEKGADGGKEEGKEGALSGGTMRTCKGCYDHLAARGRGAVVRGAGGDPTASSENMCAKTPSASSLGLDNLAAEGGPSMARTGSARDILLPLVPETARPQGGSRGAASAAAKSANCADSNPVEANIAEQFAGLDNGGDGSHPGEFQALSQTRRRLDAEGRRREEQERALAAAAQAEEEAAVAAAAAEEQSKDRGAAGLTSRLGSVRHLKWTQASSLSSSGPAAEGATVDAGATAVEVSFGEGDAESPPHAAHHPDSKIEEALALGPSGQSTDARRAAQLHLGAAAADHLEKLGRELLQTDAPLLLAEIDAAAAASKTPSVAAAKRTDLWVNALLTLATRCCATVEPDVRNGDLLDIRPYCKVKVVPGGSVEDSAYMSGVVFHKNVSHKKMARVISNAKIMMLSGGIEYARTEHRIASLDALLEQEERFFEILVGKIAKLKPDVLVVGKSVCRKAQELLLRADVALLQHAKPSLMARIARQTGATVLSSIDHALDATVLGHCRRFRLVAFRDNDVWVDDAASAKAISSDQKSVPDLLSRKIPNHERQAALAARRLGEGVLDGTAAVEMGLAKRGVAKTYVMIEGCPKELGCTVVLRGASRPALKQVKRALRFLINCAYNMKLETSYLLERCGRLPPSYALPSTPCCSSSLCVDFGQPPHNRKARPWNGGKHDPAQRSLSGKITPLDHQAILITSVWMTDQTQCCPAEVKGICYYSVQDVSLGQFLRDSCFNLSLKCQNPSCKKSVIDHSLAFIHNDGLISISVERMDNPIPTSGLQKQQNSETASTSKEEAVPDYEPIATWTFCTKCDQVVTPLVYLSKQTWQWSFGKFLEVYFYNRDAVINAPGHGCSCRMQTSSQLFFGCGSLAARFTYEKISPYSVFCRRHLPFDEGFHRTHSLQDLEYISSTSSALFVRYDRQVDAIARETRDLFGSAMNKPEHLQAVLSELNLVSAEVDNASKVLREKISSATAKYAKADAGKRASEYDEALFNFPWYSRRYLFMLASAWNERLSAAGQAVSAMKKVQYAGGSGRGDSAVVPAMANLDASMEEVIDGMRRIRMLQETYARNYNVTKMTMPRSLRGEGGLFEGNVLPDGRIATLEQEADIDDEEFYSDPENDIDFEEDVDADVLASRNRIISQGPKAASSSSSKKSSRPRPQKVLGGKRPSDLAEVPDQSSTPLALANNYDSSGQLEKAKAVTAGGAVKSALTRFFNRGSNKEDPYIVDLGFFGEGRPRLQPGIGGLIVPVFDDQPSTIIAHSLASTDYDVQFKQFLSATEKPAAPPSRKDTERRMLGRNKSHIKHTFRDFDEKGQQLCKFVCTTFWSVQFNAVRQAFMNPHVSSKDSSGGDAAAASKSATNKLDVENSYIRSLAQSFAWAASGGKSGAAFSRTTDDRFVIKCISRTELQMFLDCAPAYFEYLSKAFFHGLPTVLCKIVGVYQIGYHNRVTGRRTMEQVAVMQNIFYGRNISKIFDLKGSLRGRFTRQGNVEKEKKSGKKSKRYRRSQSDGTYDSDSYSTGDDDDDTVSTSSGGMERDDKVPTNSSEKGDKGKSATVPTLLDGDFLEFTSGRPLPLTDRAKAVFHMSILNDTLFLSIINVLDYSILVGIDEEKMELVVGIIDFMRQYDILKQMERVGKSLPMVVGSEAPTIIQPPLYKARFTNAMERYFMTVPSKWTSI